MVELFEVGEEGIEFWLGYGFLFSVDGGIGRGGDERVI